MFIAPIYVSLFIIFGYIVLFNAPSALLPSSSKSEVETATKSLPDFANIVGTPPFVSFLILSDTS